MSTNIESSRGDFGDILQLTNFFKYSDVTCHMTPEISDFVPGSLVEINKYIEVANGHLVTVKQTG